jgi:hypothetical protein
MRKVISVIIASVISATAPAMAVENEAQLPKSLSDLGVTADDLNDVGNAVTEQPTDSEMNLLQRYRRYCPRGYYLQAYRIRIGRFVIVRYRCVRFGRDRRPYNVEQPSVQQPATQQNIE